MSWKEEWNHHQAKHTFKASLNLACISARCAHAAHPYAVPPAGDAAAADVAHVHVLALTWMLVVKDAAPPVGHAAAAAAAVAAENTEPGL
eukprot:1157883-Pelagomonas_calceolata.AAC.3